MNVRYHFGRLLAAAELGLFSQSWFPLLRSFARGRLWAYDICRIAGSRDIRVCFDVGAHLGEVTDLLRRFFPDAQVHAFEPTTATHAKLSARMSPEKKVACHRLALADFVGDVTLEISPLSVLNSLKFQTDAPENKGNIDQVTVTTLAKFCELHEVGQIDVLKVDAQGFDLAVLRGGEPLLRDGRVPFILVEASILAGDTTNQPLEPLNSYVGSLGYAAAGIYEPVYHGPRNRYLGCFNVLYFHPAALSQRFPGSTPS